VAAQLELSTIVDLLFDALSMPTLSWHSAVVANIKRLEPALSRAQAAGCAQSEEMAAGRAALLAIEVTKDMSDSLQRESPEVLVEDGFVQC